VPKCVFFINESGLGSELASTGKTHAVKMSKYRMAKKLAHFYAL